MTTAFSDPGTHPVSSVVAHFHDELDDLDPRLWSMTDRGLAHVLPALTRLRHRITALELAAAHQADAVGLGTEVGAADTSAYWANTTRQTRAGAKRRLKLAAALDQHDTTRTAMTTGNVAEDQAAVIVKVVEELPVMRAEAETELVRLAAEHDAHELGILAKHILEMVAPDLAEEHQRQALEREGERALEDCRFTIADDGHGQCHGRFTVPSPVGAMLRKAVLAYAAPKHRQHSATHAGLGHAFCEYVERYPTDRLPQAGGVNATVVVRMTMESLLGDSEQPATLDTGHLITAGQARRLACEAGLIPMVLGRKFQVLDVGREGRFYTKPQRVVLDERDKTCTAVGCDWPAWMCHAHHDIHWSRGGKTDIDNGRLLCPRHHAYAHSPTYEMNKTKHGRVTFTRR